MQAKVEMVPGTWGTLAPEPGISDEQTDERAQALLEQMTLDEKTHQMSGDTPLVRGMIEMLRAYNRRPLPAGENLRLGIPGIRFSDGPRGVVMYHSTCFPVPMARGASWDVDLEARIGDAIGVEVRSQGANFFGGVCINLLRHPAWGRAQETYGEDPYHLGEMGAALVQGVQRHVMACIKHYAANSMENARFKVDVRLAERTLREVYLPQFKRCIDEGAAAVMSAYNSVNGAFCGHNRHLLCEILKGEWGFRGFVISDFIFGVKNATAVSAGLDIEMPFTIRFGRGLKRAVKKGAVSEAAIDAAVLRILRQKIRFAGIGEPERYNPEAVVSEDHRALAREAAQKSMVLLKNDPASGDGRPILPLDRMDVKRIAVIGELAAIPNSGDRGSSMVRPPYVVTPLEGIRAAAENGFEILHDAGREIATAVEVARGADVAIVVAGYTHEQEGEYIKILFSAKGGDRATLTLPAHDEQLIAAVAAANPRTVVVMMGGSAIITEAWRHQVPGILMAWYPGMEGGHAIADVLFGAVNPSGKLPCSFPRSADHLPFFDRDAEKIEYGYFHGYWLLDRDEHEAAFPFGFGLSYTTFAYSDLRVGQETIGPDGSVAVGVTITNTGDWAGEEVVQLYVGCEDSAVVRPHRALKGFQKVALGSGEGRRVAFCLSAQDLAFYDEATGVWVTEPGTYRVHVGPSSREADLLAGTFRITTG